MTVDEAKRWCEMAREMGITQLVVPGEFSAMFGHQARAQTDGTDVQKLMDDMPSDAQLLLAATEGFPQPGERANE